MKKTEEDTNARPSRQLQAIYRFHVISIKIPVAFFTEIYMEPQKTPKSPSNSDKEQSWRHHTC